MGTRKRKRNAKCFVAGCNSGYESNKKKISMFAVPSDEARLEEWRRMIPARKDIQLNENCVVCELHFCEEYVVKNYTHIVNGEVVAIPRGQPLLKKDAIPTIFPDTSKPQRKTRASKRQSRSPPKKKAKTSASTKPAKNMKPASDPPSQPVPHKKVKTSDTPKITKKTAKKRKAVTDPPSSKKKAKKVQVTYDPPEDPPLLIDLIDISLDDIMKLDPPEKFWVKHYLQNDPNTVIFAVYIANFPSREEKSRLHSAECVNQHTATSLISPVVAQKLLSVTKLEDSVVCKAYVRDILTVSVEVNDVDIVKELLLKTEQSLLCEGSGTLQEFDKLPRCARLYSAEKLILHEKCSGVATAPAKLCSHCAYLRDLLIASKTMILP